MINNSVKHGNKPVIGVTGNARRFSPSWICIALSIRLTGGIPVRISTKQHCDVDSLDALVISGGDDIHPSLFGAEPRPRYDYDVARDKLEQDYLRAATDRSLPVLGICRGHQILNVTFGGSLLLDIRASRRKTSNRRGLLATKTGIVTKKSRLLESLLGKHSLKINSLHYQAVDRVAAGFETAATDLDGFCQAIEFPRANMLGVQWHPEYLFYRQDHRAFFSWIVDAACKNADRSEAMSDEPGTQLDEPIEEPQKQAA